MMALRLIRGAVRNKYLPSAWCSPSALYSTVTPDSGQSALNEPDDKPVELENPFKQPPKKCILCDVTVDFKNVQLLSQFVSPHTGRIYGRHITGLCGRKQRAIAKAIKRAHIMGFMPIAYKDPAFINDPKICNV
ncbi:small ribosomal subunit protein bS18m [Hyperolius riggenbachi]|uniref:small ribosomal subunit protein bS18m n=1 Tax=Hyperolius riggenbachi TaxID=752182 RepID=UPI0035A34C33